jgi:hypothetical protein
MITYLLNQAALAGFNLINVRIDAYRIMNNKTIAHGINFAAYALFCALLCWLAQWDAWEIVIFCVSAFCNRNITFDIPLNLRRHLPWDYVSPAKPPKALLDQIEIRIWGYNGRAPLVCYALVWFVCLIIKIWV